MLYKLSNIYNNIDDYGILTKFLGSEKYVLKEIVIENWGIWSRLYYEKDIFEF